MESANGEKKFISGDYSCGTALLLPVAKHKTAVSGYPTPVFLYFCPQTSRSNLYIQCNGR